MSLADHASGAGYRDPAMPRTRDDEPVWPGEGRRRLVGGTREERSSNGRPSPGAGYGYRRAVWGCEIIHPNGYGGVHLYTPEGRSAV